MHKTLFDVASVRRLITAAGFHDTVIYRYAYGREPNPVNLGFVAWKTARPNGSSDAREIVNSFASINQLNQESIEWNL